MAKKSLLDVDELRLPDSSRDPLSKMVEILKDPDLSDTDKQALLNYAKRKFDNRRRMAYIALFAIIASLALLFLAAFVEGALTVINQNQTLIIWIEGFLASIVAAYYGVSAWRPSS